jgi:hypothetical protein
MIFYAKAQRNAKFAKNKFNILANIAKPLRLCVKLKLTELPQNQLKHVNFVGNIGKKRFLMIFYAKAQRNAKFAKNKFNILANIAKPLRLCVKLKLTEPPQNQSQHVNFVGNYGKKRF